jgi:uncharacterized membrane protein YecN with MAPEG domain
MITALYGGLLGLVFLALSMRVIWFRRKGIYFGDGGDPQLQRAIRGHANFAEYVPLALVLMLLLESGGASNVTLHALGLALLVARMLHGYALSFTPKFVFGRFWGTVLTFTVIGVAALLCVWRATNSFIL